MRILERLASAIRSSAVFYQDVQIAPACILWPDHDRQWEAALSRLREELPELLTLGSYAPEERTGPAIWLRCAIGGTLPEIIIPHGAIPILYLPGISRQDLRAVESCPDILKPLAELQYRGVIWSQVNAKDWTILAYLMSNQGGLGLDVSHDNDTKEAMQLALHRLIDEETELLAGRRLDKDYFNTLLTGGDPVRDLLLWLDQGEAFEKGRGPNEWKAFVELVKSQFAFNPITEGILEGASRLANHKDAWRVVWERFAEAPKRYPNIPARIRQSTPPSFDLFDDAATVGGWPQWNDEQERRLRDALLAFDDMAPHDARAKIIELEHVHGARRDLVWAELEESPFALALEHLNTLANVTQTTMAAGTVDELATRYQTHGWRADDAFLQSLAMAERTPDTEGITRAVRAMYLNWAEESARYLQKLIDGATYPRGTIDTTVHAPRIDGECILFVDGLRFDVARRLIEKLQATGCTVAERTVWAALPSVTATGKPAVTPVAAKIRGRDANAEFDPCVAATDKSLAGGYNLKKLLTDDGWQILESTDTGDPQGNAWFAFGDIDTAGHKSGWKMARQIPSLLGDIQKHISALLDAGWKHVRIVTDHGWLLMPGGLPKIELPSQLTDSKWGRCAAIKPGATTQERLYPWFWNPSQHFALADGISCFKSGQQYAHGGLSFQECLTLELTVTRGNAPAQVAIEIADIVWKGMRCTVVVDGPVAGLSADIRKHAGAAASSVAISAKELKENGTASLVVEDEDLEGTTAHLVLLDAGGGLVASMTTVIGGMS